MLGGNNVKIAIMAISVCAISAAAISPIDTEVTSSAITTAQPDSDASNADSTNQSSNIQSKSVAIKVLAPTKLTIGSYSIGKVRDGATDASSFIYSTSVSDSGNTRDLVYLFDTLRQIRTIYPKFNAENFETSKEFTSMYQVFTEKFGKPSKVTANQSVVNSENQFGKSLKKSWIWILPDGQVQLIVINALVDKEMLRNFSRAQAQQYEKTDYRYRNRPISDIENELFFGMTQAITPSTQIQLKIWGNISGDRLGLAMVKCAEHSNSCELKTDIGPSAKEFADIDAPATWYHLSNGTAFNHKGSQPVMGEPIDLPRKGMKQISENGYSIQMLQPSTDKNTANQYVKQVRSSFPNIALDRFAYADKIVKDKITQSMISNLVEPMISSTMACPALRIENPDEGIQKKQSY